ncbi:hypothetical protein [Oceaniglobus ichthyenteri]|uniref:hypothetical protein n=1 Tax=Oceaniglobus ichthyenteri TaxID=2136177 RepID=UPI000D37547C|nr:hypothetical protein [Oceaniglobus ichthyenteri]
MPSNFALLAGLQALADEIGPVARHAMDSAVARQGHADSMPSIARSVVRVDDDPDCTVEAAGDRVDIRYKGSRLTYRLVSIE